MTFVWSGATDVDGELVARMLFAEFNRFQEGFESVDWSEEQQFRGRALLWWAALAPETIPERLITEMGALVRQSRASDTYSNRDWILLVPLEAALAILTPWAGPIDHCVWGLCQGGSGVRFRVSRDLALVAPYLHSRNEALTSAVVLNFERHHFYQYEALAIYAASAGSKAEKTKQIQEWHAQWGGPGATDPTINELHDKGYMRNPLSDTVNRVSRYVALRLATAWQELPVQLGEVGANASTAPPGTGMARLIWQRLEEHSCIWNFVPVEDRDFPQDRRWRGLVTVPSP